MKIYPTFTLILAAFISGSATADALNPMLVEHHNYYSFGIISNELGGGDTVSRFMLPSIMEKELDNAEKGDAKSQYTVAVMYGRGVGFENNLKISKKWHSKAIEQGYLYDPFELNSLTKRLKNPIKLESVNSRMSIKGFKIGQKKAEVSGRWAELSIEPLACESIGAGKDGYPWEKCIVGVTRWDIEPYPMDGSKPIVPAINTAEDKTLSVGLIPLQRVEFNFRGDTLVDANFKLVDSKTLYNPNYHHPAYQLEYDSCPKVDLCMQYQKQFSKDKGIKVKFDQKYGPHLDYEKCGTKKISWITNQESMTCWGRGFDNWGRNDLFLSSQPGFKEPGTITRGEYREWIKRQDKEKERQKTNDL